MEDPLDFKKDDESDMDSTEKDVKINDNVKMNKGIDLDSDEVAEEKSNTNEEMVDPDSQDSSSDTKKLIFTIFGIIGLFVLFFAGGYVYNNFIGNSSPSAMTIDDLHELNLAGNGAEGDYMYNGFSFVYFDNLWYTQVQAADELIDIPLHFGPDDLEGISVSGNISDAFKKEQVYVTFDPTDDSLKFVALSSAELSLNLAKGIGVVPVAACDRNETDTCASRPIVTCEDSDKAVIYLKQTPNSTANVNLNGNCVEIEGDGWELMKATDKFLLLWYNVMER